MTDRAIQCIESEALTQIAGGAPDAVTTASLEQFSRYAHCWLGEYRNAPVSNNPWTQPNERNAYAEQKCAPLLTAPVPATGGSTTSSGTTK